MNIDDGQSNVRTEQSEAASGDDQVFGTIADAVDEFSDQDFWDEEHTDDDPGDAEGDQQTELSDEGEVEETDEQTLADDDAETDETDETDDSDPDEKVMILMDDGEELPLSELKTGFMLRKDYTHKTGRLAEERAAMEQSKTAYDTNLEQVQNAFTGLETFLKQIIPPEPDMSLLYNGDPQGGQEYHIAKETRQMFLNQLNQVMQGAQQLKDVHSKNVADQLETVKKTEHARLLEVRPNLRDSKQLEAYDRTVSQTAKQFGFSDDDIAKTHDHRLKELVYYASIGKRAEQNRANARKRQTGQGKAKTSVRRVSRQARGRAAAQSQRAQQSAQAMKRLEKTGSLNDAMMVDFEM